ncbi:MAG: aspartate carbamoyltransferase regulatory subunit [Calditrichaeota bacterium]|nr:aspartate carbamoyltransferase regulatory subunit [Calditrichota bacterium]
MSERNEKVLMIPKIKLGIVIDHIPAGEGVKILEIISRYEEMQDVPVTLGLNYDSKKMGRKDLIKMQLEFLSPEIIQHISIVVPGVTIKAIKDYRVYSKVVVQAPKVIKNLLLCKNPNCVTNLESGIETLFHAVDEESNRVRCNFCERIFDRSELKPIIK